MYDSLRPHKLQHASLPFPSLSPWVYSNPCPLIKWCYPTILSSAAPFSFCPQSFPVSRSFPITWLFASGSQSIRTSSSAPVLPMNHDKLWKILQEMGMPDPLSSLRRNLYAGQEATIRTRYEYMMLGAGALGWPRGIVLGVGFKMGNTCTLVADSCWCMAKPIQYCKVISLQLK